MPNYYTLCFSLIQHHKYSLSEIEQMYPYERDLYVDMLKDHLEQEQQRLSS